MSGDGLDGGFVDLAGPPPLVIVPTIDGPFRGASEIPPLSVPVAVGASATSTAAGRVGRGPPPRTDGAVSIP